ncbi:MAG: hypothetical protein WC551_07085 [Patescibacteria group bacterium]
MAQKELPYRFDGKDRHMTPPGKREEYVRSVLEKKFGVKDPLRWIAVQAEADVPDTGSWHDVWLQEPSPFKLDEGRGIELLRDYGERVAPFVLRGQESTADVIASLMDRAKAELFDSESGYFLVVPQPLELFKLHRSPIFNTASCNVYSSEDFTSEEYWGLLEATVFRAWKDEDRVKSVEARSLICKPYAKAIADAAHEADDEYGRATILGTLSRNGYPFKESKDLQKINHIVVWTAEDGGLEAWLFDGSSFTPDSFQESAVPLLLPRSASSIDEVLYGETGWLFKTRKLVALLRDLSRYHQTLWLMSCCMSKRGEPPLVDEDILFVKQCRLKHPLPDGGKKLF